MQFLTSMRNLALIIFLLFISFAVNGQQVIILDANSGNTVLNVAVFNGDKSKTAVTDFDGKCDLSIFDKNERITFKHLSYDVFKSTPAQIIKRGNRVYLHLKPEQQPIVFYYLWMGYV